MEIYKSTKYGDYYFLFQRDLSQNFVKAVYYYDSHHKELRKFQMFVMNKWKLRNNEFEKIELNEVMFDDQLKKRILKTILSDFYFIKLLLKFGRKWEEELFIQFAEKIQLLDSEHKKILKRLIEIGSDIEELCNKDEEVNDE